jgi:hypothetical protein
MRIFIDGSLMRATTGHTQRIEYISTASSLASPHEFQPTWERFTYLSLQRMYASSIFRYGVVVDVDRSLGESVCSGRFQ